MRSYGYPPETGTWEYIETYVGRTWCVIISGNKLPLPANLMNALVGLLMEMLDMNVLDYRSVTKGTILDHREWREDSTAKAE